MSQYATILIPDPGAASVASVLASNASAGVNVGVRKKFTVTAVDSTLTGVPFNLEVGSATVAATSGSDMFLPGKYTMATGAAWGHVSVYNPTSATITVYISGLANS